MTSDQRESSLKVPGGKWITAKQQAGIRTVMADPVCVSACMCVCAYVHVFVSLCVHSVPTSIFKSPQEFYRHLQEQSKN